MLIECVLKCVNYFHLQNRASIGSLHVTVFPLQAPHRSLRGRTAELLLLLAVYLSVSE